MKEILKEIRDAGKKTLIMIHHDRETIKGVFKQFEEHLSQLWWDVLFGWSPTETSIFNALINFIIALLILISINLILSIVILVWNWRMLQEMAALTLLSKVFGLVLRDTRHMSWVDEEESVY